MTFEPGGQLELSGTEGPLPDAIARLAADVDATRRPPCGTPAWRWAGWVSTRCARPGGSCACPGTKRWPRSSAYRTDR